MNLYVKVGIAIVAAVIGGPKVEAELRKLVKPESDFASKALQWGAPVATGMGAFMLANMLMGSK